MTVGGQTLTELAWFALLVAVLVPMLRASIGGAPFLPTPWRVARRMVALGRVGPGDHVVDPGCGDGRLLVAALETGASTAVGYELFVFAFVVAWFRSLRWKGRMRVRFRDSRKASFTDRNVALCYMLPGPMAAMRPQFLSMGPGARVISHAFAIEGWDPAERDEAIPSENQPPLYLYVVPVASGQ